MENNLPFHPDSALYRVSGISRQTNVDQNEAQFFPFGSHIRVTLPSPPPFASLCFFYPKSFVDTNTVTVLLRILDFSTR
jgi:hypothetical protein